MTFANFAELSIIRGLIDLAVKYVYRMKKIQLGLFVLLHTLTIILKITQMITSLFSARNATAITTESIETKQSEITN